MNEVSYSKDGDILSILYTILYILQAGSTDVFVHYNDYPWFKSQVILCTYQLFTNYFTNKFENIESLFISMNSFNVAGMS